MKLSLKDITVLSLVYRSTPTPQTRYQWLIEYNRLYGRYIGAISSGTFYPALNRLVKENWLKEAPGGLVHRGEKAKELEAETEIIASQIDELGHSSTGLLLILHALYKGEKMAGLILGTIERQLMSAIHSAENSALSVHTPTLESNALKIELLMLKKWLSLVGVLKTSDK